MQDEAGRDQLVMSLLASAIAQAPEERDRYLRSSCGADDAL